MLRYPFGGRIMYDHQLFILRCQWISIVQIFSLRSKFTVYWQMRKNYRKFLSHNFQVISFDSLLLLLSNSSLLLFYHQDLSNIILLLKFVSFIRLKIFVAKCLMYLFCHYCFSRQKSRRCIQLIIALHQYFLQYQSFVLINRHLFTVKD